MTSLKNVKKLVTEMLTEDARTRNSDYFLFLRICQKIADENNIDLNGISVVSFLLDKKQYPFPPFETVRRNRQKVQRANPELAACEKVQEYRDENEVVFREFARA